MKMKLSYNCKFCNRPGEVEYQDEGLLAEERVAHWLKHIACARCADWHRSRSDLCALIYQAANNWLVLVQSGQEIPSEVGERADGKFQRLLSRLCAATGKYKNCRVTYDSEMADELTRSPHRASPVISKIIQTAA
jgi:hypothetical protein